ncbi:acetyltransferase [Nitratiruptor sp. YY09-18]|uniref:acetyltransferase n=1 Tax=Nitratiruptor sp. YY09-18 TaxID=2724901 RepID=UPI0019163F64|nr:acetyltransferase [Nitratiruptor sp. YY09-18]BCD67755.1 UDP-N-acetylbacillosamine N-acetyltransferase [Nitratiruptor sp. YY09-18]
MKKIGIYGASGHGKVVADIASLLGYTYIFIDDGKNEYIDFATYQKRYNYPIAWGIGDNATRAALAQRVSEQITLIHPQAMVSNSAKIAPGCVVMAGVVINADAKIGEGTIINTGSIIEHDCKIGKFCHIAPNCALAGGVEVDNRSFIGIGSCVIPQIKIGKESIIGAGSVVLKDVPPKVIAYGNPAKIKGYL